MQPVEPLWPLVREALANKVFPTLAALTDPLAKRCQVLAADPATVRAIRVPHESLTVRIAGYTPLAPE